MALASGVMDMVPDNGYDVDKLCIHITPMSFCKRSSRASTVRVRSGFSGPHSRKISSSAAVGLVVIDSNTRGCNSSTRHLLQSMLGQQLHCLLSYKPCCAESASMLTSKVNGWCGKRAYFLAEMQHRAGHMLTNLQSDLCRGPLPNSILNCVVNELLVAVTPAETARIRGLLLESANMPHALNDAARTMLKVGHQYVVYHAWLLASTMTYQAQAPVGSRVRIHQRSRTGMSSQNYRDCRTLGPSYDPLLLFLRTEEHRLKQAKALLLMRRTRNI
jgi:hypothetical protein